MPIGILQFMLVKPDGGLRGIAKLRSLVRLGARIRYPLIARWYQNAARKYDRACAGGTAEMAVWTQLLEAEGLQDGSGPEVQGRAAALLDLVKCFEKDRVDHVWKWGMFRKVATKLLRMGCVTYSMARRVQYRGSLSSEAETVTAIVPGSVFVIAALRMVRLHPWDLLVARWPVRLCRYVDDLGIASKGASKEVVRELTDAAQRLINELEVGLRLDVSKETADTRGKSVAIASNPWLRGALRPRLAILGIAFATTVNHLGCRPRAGGNAKWPKWTSGRGASRKCSAGSRRCFRPDRGEPGSSR